MSPTKASGPPSFGIRQEGHQIVDAAGLMADDTFPRGSRPKQWYVVAGSGKYPFLLGGHRYLFKESMQRRPAQFWSEIVASEIGELAGVGVPPTYAAVDSARGVPGAFIEYFLQFPGGDPTERFTHAVDHLQMLQRNFDTRKGTNHNLRTNLLLIRAFERRAGLVGGLDFFARTLMFDALIGNTDRHQENWGFIWSEYNQQQRVRAAPAFDNGTSLGYELTEARLPDLTGDLLDRYIGRGTHHMRPQESSERANHADLCRLFAQQHPFAIPKMLNTLTFPEDHLRARLERLVRFEMPVKLSEARAEFMLRATLRRRELLGNVLMGLGTGT